MSNSELIDCTRESERWRRRARGGVDKKGRRLQERGEGNGRCDRWKEREGERDSDVREMESVPEPLLDGY